jgi:hypothetical protein
VRDRLLELGCDAERRARVELAPDQQGGHSNAGQQVALVRLGHREQLRPEAVGTNGGGDLLEQRDELGRRFAREPPRKRKGGFELLGGRSQRLRRARDPGAQLLLGQRSLPAGVGTR